MTRPSNRFNTLTLNKLKTPGRYADGNGLYLEISERGTKSWIFRFKREHLNKGIARSMGLGPYPVVGLAEARTKALECRRLLLDGVDPIEERRAKFKARALEDAKAISFDQCAKTYIESHRSGWKNDKHAAQWESTLETYAKPRIGDLPVQAIDTGLVMRVLEPIWHEKAETASRLRSRIELILDWATVRGYRTGDNPARWRGHLDKLLPKRSKVQRVEHHTALPFKQVGEFMTALRAQGGIAPLALEFLILTATRTGEVLGATWSEFCLEEGTWTIPAERMKAGREHRVPLSSRALEILAEARTFSDGEFVFPGFKKGRPLSNMALLAVLKRMESEVTTHGFRSTFRDWAAELTNFPREVAEAALAHALKDKVEAAYRRGDLFEKRRKLMVEWSDFCKEASLTENLRQTRCESPAGKVIASC